MSPEVNKKYYTTKRKAVIFLIASFFICLAMILPFPLYGLLLLYILYERFSYMENMLRATRTNGCFINSYFSFLNNKLVVDGFLDFLLMLLMLWCISKISGPMHYILKVAIFWNYIRFIHWLIAIDKNLVFPVDRPFLIRIIGKLINKIG